jgi:hypothetical protein
MFDVIFTRQTNCKASIQQSFVVISMSRNSTVYYHVSKNRHLHLTEKVEKFAVISRKDFAGQIQCENNLNEHNFPTFNSPALPKEII